ncbi:MAG TPA: Rieske 2Fe-2S domain-containing protein [Acidimicrobiia bacterium]|jgi:cytochrome b6-f complex iron-sulfur subunit|nr:Rieske 2Fe-2S domain-containing protein [Acidimicrobiia bacterium]
MSLLDVAALTVLAVAALVTIHFLLRAGASRRSVTRTMRRSAPDRPGASVEQAARSVDRAGGPTAAGELALLRDAPLTSRHVPDDEALGITRREFFNRGLLGTVAIALAGGVSTVIAYLWPSSGGGFGGTIPAGNLDTMLSFIDTNKQPFYVPEARTYIVRYPAADLPAARKSNAYPDFILAGMQQGIVALYQRCTHLGCRVPWCPSSQWFECPCHGSKYNRVGEKRDGPAPRGLDRFQALIHAGNVTVNTGLLAVGPPIGTNTTGQVADGPHCVG